MSEINKEELIEKLKDSANENFLDNWGKGYKMATNIAIRLAEQLPDTPKKVVVLQCVDNFIKRHSNPIYEACCFYDTYGDDGNGNNDYPKEFAEWLDNNFNTFYNAVVNGYEVEQPKRWVVAMEGQYFKNWTGISPFSSFLSYKKEFCYEFENKHEAELVAELIGGEVEEV